MTRYLPVLLLIAAPVLAQPLPLPPHLAEAADAPPGRPVFPLPPSIPTAAERAPGFVPPLPPRRPGDSVTPPEGPAPSVAALPPSPEGGPVAAETTGPGGAAPPAEGPAAAAATGSGSADTASPETPPLVDAPAELAATDEPVPADASTPDAPTTDEPSAAPGDVASVVPPGDGPIAAPKSQAEVRFDACLVEAQAQPAAALTDAQAWEDQGGGTFARRCAAAAKLANGQAAPAARDYEDLARELVILDPDTAITLYRKAGEAWIVAGQPMRAQGIAAEGMKTDPDDAGLLLLRAAAALSLSDYSDAKASLDRAIANSPKVPQLYVMRATVAQRAGRTSDAMTDAQLALLLDPRNLDALLLRGRLREATGDLPGALSDWRTVIGIDPTGPAGDDARTEITRVGGTP